MTSRIPFSDRAVGVFAVSDHAAARWVLSHVCATVQRRVPGFVRVVDTTSTAPEQVGGARLALPAGFVVPVDPAPPPPTAQGSWWVVFWVYGDGEPEPPWTWVRHAAVLHGVDSTQQQLAAKLFSQARAHGVRTSGLVLSTQSSRYAPSVHPRREETPWGRRRNEHAFDAVSREALSRSPRVVSRVRAPVRALRRAPVSVPSALRRWRPRDSS